MLLYVRDVRTTMFNSSSSNISGACAEDIEKQCSADPSSCMIKLKETGCLLNQTVIVNNVVIDDQCMDLSGKEFKTKWASLGGMEFKVSYAFCKEGEFDVPFITDVKVIIVCTPPYSTR